MCLAKRQAYNIKKKECFINVDETFLLFYVICLPFSKAHNAYNYNAARYLSASRAALHPEPAATIA